jgi:polar amino acid transport system permease protein
VSRLLGGPPPLDDRPISEAEAGRRAFRRGRQQRSVLVAALSTVVFALVAWFSVTSTPGWPRVQETFFSWEHAVEALPSVWDGFLLNLRVLLVASVLVLIVGLVIALLRTLRGAVFFPLRFLAAAYTDVFRGIPLILVLYLVGFGIPGLRIVDGFIPGEVLGTAALVLTYSAYVAEVFRAGIEAVHPSQRLAARALGLGYVKTLRLVVIPQAVRKVTPALMNDFVALQKDVGLISVLGAVDAVRSAQIETASSFNFTPYVVAGVLFVLLAIPTVRLTDWYTARVRRREQMGAIV